MKYDFCVFIGRFQPFHNGHLSVIQQALKQARKVIVFIGGANGARRPRNPWSAHERHMMIRESLGAEYARLEVLDLPDFTYNETKWVETVQREVDTTARSYLGFPKSVAPKIALIGRKKDNSGYYLNLFPQWDSIVADATHDLDATTIRRMMFERGEIPGKELVPAPVSEQLVKYLASDEGRRMRAEWKFIKTYKQTHDAPLAERLLQWLPPTLLSAVCNYLPKLPHYHRNNVTADAVVVQGGHILVVRRKSTPGKGKLALPGGHVNRDELPRDAAVRELQEETGIKIPTPALYGAIEKYQDFSDPYRSDLARTYTFAYLFRLKNEGPKLARLKAGSDAESAFWIPINEIVESDMFDDHYHIITSMLGIG